MYKAAINLSKFREMTAEEVERFLSEELGKNPNDEHLNESWNACFERLQQTHKDLSKSFIQRDEAIRMVLAGLISGVPNLLMGPPGTAKSAMVGAIAKACGIGGIGNQQYFEYLLTNHTMPEELFGGIDLEILQEGRVVKNTAGKMPVAEIAFLDEVFRGGSHILNTLLTIINERRYDSGDGTKFVPLLGIIGASNFAPTDEILEAFFDRFPIRFWVQPVLTPRRFVEAGSVDDARILLQSSMKQARSKLSESWGKSETAESPPTICTNDFRLARFVLLHKLDRLGGNSERFETFEKNFRVFQPECKLSDRSFAQLWMVAGALDLLDGRKLSGSHANHRGVYDVFRFVARSEAEAKICNDRVNQRLGKSNISGN